MRISNLFQSFAPLRYVSLTMLSVLLLNTPTTVLAGAGHDHGSGAFQAGSEASGQVEVDEQTAKGLGIKVETVKPQRLDIGIKTNGKIETLPSQKVEVTTPISGAKVVELLVEPGARVKKGQPVAVVTSPDLVNLRVESQEKLAQGQADLQQALADLKLAEQNYDRFQNIAAAEIAQAQSQVAFAQEKYNKDKQLTDAGALPRRSALESQTQLAQAQAELAQANSRRDVFAAENQLKRAQAAVKVAKERIRLSNSIYQTRLAQLQTIPSNKGLVTVTAPISGQIANREVTIGQSFEDAGSKLMTIVNDSQVFATANIYEKDLGKVKMGQPVKVRVASVPNQIFTGRIKRIGSVVEGETQVIPVQAAINNANGQLKPGMFAELEVVTDKTSAAVLAIPSSAVVDANGKKIIYVKNGNAFQSVEAEFGQTSGNLIEVTSGLFEGDAVVTQRAPQLYAQSLRGGSTKEDDHSEEDSYSETTNTNINNFPLPVWLIATVGGTVIAGGAFAAGSFWSGRRNQSRMLAAYAGISSELAADQYQNTDENANNHQAPKTQIGRLDSSVKNNSDS
ncbi:MAG: efflux RND transporter periplasmic adaptor subunit [Trichormus sp. ATA11-4-KO1]|nr:efflux RND transporter periplasmic adaptor subunit [Trichormus sp. ATA11-4-KO1]